MNASLCIKSVCALFFFAPAFAYADSANNLNTPDNHHPAGFQADISKPTPQVNIDLPKTEPASASPRSQLKWQAYNQPMRDCIPGMTIMPSKNHKLFAFLFSNTPDINTNVTVSFLGWQKNKQCAVNFIEGAYVKSCLFDKKSLVLLMNDLLNPHLFDLNGSLAKTLAAVCQNSGG